MPRVSLTDRFVISAKPNKGEAQTDFFDEHEPGLALRVSSTKRAWTFIFTSPKDGKRARLTLGSYPATSLSSARTRAREARGLVEEQRDPRDVFAAQDAGAMTVARLADVWRPKRDRRFEETKQRLERNVIPVIGSVRLADLHRRDITRIIDPILERDAPAQANMVFRHVRALLNWGVKKGYLDHNPMAGMEQPAEESARERVLSDEEIQSLWKILPEALAQSAAVQRIIKLCLITAQRPGEVTGLRKSELDLKHRTWAMPSSRTKNGNPHSVPLSDLALEVIEEAIKASGSEFLFPSPEPEPTLPHINPRAVARTIARAHKSSKDKPLGRFEMAPWSAHDLRRTALTGLAKLGVQPIVIGSVANHLSVTKANVTFAHYVHHDYGEEKRAALDLWAARVAGIIDGGAQLISIASRRSA